MIPSSATIYVMAVHVGAPDHPDVSFDALDSLREGYAPLRLHTVSHVKLSAAEAAMRFDFANLPTQCGSEVRLKLRSLRRGTCNAVAWWFDLSLSNEVTLNVGPGAAVRTWKQNLFYLPQPLELDRGDEVEVIVWNKDDDNIHVFAGRPGTLPETLSAQSQGP